MPPISGEWQQALSEEFQKPYYKELYQRVVKEYHTTRVYPPAEDIFNAFHLTPLHEVKVVILGQDPYINEGQAHGLCFSVKKPEAPPPSLVNIYQELHDDLGCEIPKSGDLTKWAKQGVLLLNTVLTVRAHESMSHRGIGWEKFTDAVIKQVNKEDRPIVFLLWGAPAGRKSEMLDNPKHLILKAPHPSPLSA
ncbi:MAG: uracil-DNA glycosylase, partial [Lachnospiraceae bacterium]|nr:uracil-DNA glycosylase [Lachnospiraceae bacterium]